MRENYSVGCEEKGCSRQGETEQRTVGNESPQVSTLLKNFFFFFHLNWNGKYEMQREIWWMVPTKPVALKQCSTIPMFTRLCAGGAAKKAAKPPQPKKKNSGSESEKKKASNTEKKKPPPPKKSDPYYEMETENLNVSFVHNVSLCYHRTVLRKKRKDEAVLNRKKPRQQVLEQHTYM